MTMDAPRRWQVASAVTALAGLGLGGVLMSRPSIEDIEPIRLQVVSSPASPDAPATRSIDSAGEVDDDELTIVDPEVLADVRTPDTPATVASPDEPDDAADTTAGTTGTATDTSSGTARPAPAPAPSVPAVADDVDSIDSDDSVDSDD
jgi:hypothetical protein